MLCGNTKAEIDRDQAPESAQSIYVKEQQIHKQIVSALLQGKSVFGCKLSTHMIGRHDAFEKMANDDYDFMAKFKDGHLEHYRNLLTTEAKTLASVIMGK